MHLTTAEIEESLRRLFGESASTVALSSNDRLGRRIFGVDLTQPLTPEQAELMVSLLDRYKLISFPNQGEGQFRIRHLERLANHFGAPIPHPKNYANYADDKKRRFLLRCFLLSSKPVPSVIKPFQMPCNAVKMPVVPQSILSPTWLAAVLINKRRWSVVCIGTPI